MEEEYFTINEAIGRTGKSEATIRRLVRMLRTQYEVGLGDTNDQIIQKTSLLRKRNESTDKDEEPIFEWLIAASTLENLIDDSQSTVDDPGQQDSEHGLDSPDHAHDDSREKDHDDLQTDNDIGHEDSQFTDDNKHDDGREDVQRRPNRRRDYTKTINIPVAVFESLNETINVLQNELGEKNEQLASRGREAEHLQAMFAVAQEKALQLPSGTLVRREERNELPEAQSRSPENE